MYRIGIDLGGTNIAAGIVDDRGEIIAKESIPTEAPRAACSIADDIAELAFRLIHRAGLKEENILGVGVGAPGTVEPESGVVEYSCNLQFEDVPLGRMLSKRLQKKVAVENDANAAAYGEFLAGAASRSNPAVMVTVGTGIGGGVVINGKIYRGYNFDGGEIGHTVIACEGHPCACGRKGCWEAYASVAALISMTREAMRSHPESLMWAQTRGNPGNVNGKTAFEAMRSGDAAGKMVVDRYLFYLGCGLVNVVNMFQPEVLCIGGGISHEGDTIIRPLTAMIERERYSRHASRQTRLCAARLGNDAGIIGSAMLL